MTYIQGPGVYEMDDSFSQVQAMETATRPAFVGRALMGPCNQAMLIHDFSEFERIFGTYHCEFCLADAVFHFFSHSSLPVYCVRIIGAGATKASLPLDDTILLEAQTEGAWGNDLSILRIPLPPNVPEDGKTFGLKLYLDNQQVGEFPILSLEKSLADGKPNPYYIETILNANQRYFHAVPQDQENPTAPVFSLEDEPKPISFSGGSDGAPICGDDITGEESGGGLKALDTISDVNLLALPEIQYLTDSNQIRPTALAALEWCQKRDNCFFILDTPPDLTPTQAIDYKTGNGTDPTQPFISRRTAMYYPWIGVLDQVTKAQKFIPPSAHIAGVISNTDQNYGVHLAPAGTARGRIVSALATERALTQTDLEQLNTHDVNAISKMSMDEIVVWGARTTSQDLDLRYVNISRYLLFLETYLTQATLLVPGSHSSRTELNQDMQKRVNGILMEEWKKGILFGNTAEQAFFVKCGADNNPPHSHELHIDVGVSVIRPAEFYILRIMQQLVVG